jgi:hypothetical protein
VNEEIKDWGCPDWRDREAYPANPDDLKDWQWRWEFLKRTKEYRQAWQRGEPIEDDPAEFEYRLFSPEDLEYGRTAWGLPNLPHPKSDFRGFHSIFTKRAGGLGLVITSPEEVLNFVEKFNLEPEQQIELLRSEFRSLQGFHDHLREGVLTLGMFDLGAPIKPQLEAIEHMLKIKQKQHLGKLASQLKKNRRGNWPRHLRVIDAEDQGATPSQIWVEIMGAELDVKEYDKKADGNISQAGTNMIDAARGIMVKASRFL